MALCVRVGFLGNILCVCGMVRPVLCTSQVDSAWSGRRLDEARSNSNTAKILNIVGFIIGIGAYVIVAIVVIIQIIVSVVITSSANHVTHDFYYSTHAPYYY